MGFQWTSFFACLTLGLYSLTSGQSDYRSHDSRYQRLSQPSNTNYQQQRHSTHSTSSETGGSKHVDYEQIRRMVRQELEQFRRDQMDSGHHQHLSAFSRDLQELGRKVDQLMLRQNPSRDVGQQLERRFDSWLTQLEQRFFNDRRSCEGLERSMAELKTKLDYIQQMISQHYIAKEERPSWTSGGLRDRLQDPYQYNNLRNSQSRVTIEGPRYNGGQDSSRETIPDPRRDKTNDANNALPNVLDRESDYKFRYDGGSVVTPAPTMPSTPFWRHIRTVATAAPRPINHHRQATYDGNNYRNSHYSHNTNSHSGYNQVGNAHQRNNGHLDSNEVDPRGSLISSQTGSEHVEIQLPRASNYSFRYPEVIGEDDDSPAHRQPETTYRPTHRPTERPTYRPTERPTYQPTQRPTYRPTYRPTPYPYPTQRPTLRQWERPTPRPTEHPSKYVRYYERANERAQPTPHDPYRHQPPRNQVLMTPRPEYGYRYNAVTSPPRRESLYRFRYTKFFDATGRPQTSPQSRVDYNDNTVTTPTPRTAQWYNNWIRHGRQSALSRESSAENQGRRAGPVDRMDHRVLSDEESSFRPSAKYGQCPLYMRGLGTSELERKSLYSLVGTWMGDSGAKDERVWSVEGGNALHWNSLVEYEDIEAFETLIGQTQHTLPEFCTGLGPVVFKGHLYCQAYIKNSDEVSILKIDLETKEIVARRHLSAQHGRHLGVSGKGWAGIYLQLQLMVDESGMWALAGETETRRLVLFQLDPTDLKVLSMTRLARRKDTVGPTFMTCGVLYALDSHYATQLAYAYDTKRQQEKNMDKNTEFSFPPLEVISMQYNPVDRKLYMWKVTKKSKKNPLKRQKNSRKRMYGIGERLSPHTTINDYLF